MQAGTPSRTAWAAAAHRAAHQLLDGGRIFSDALALPILGETPGGSAAETPGDASDDADVLERSAFMARARSDSSARRMRVFIAMRTRVAEDALAAAVARGTSQLVVLGAGLDTFAYRSPFAERLSVFEVDHPATQAWKRGRLASAGIALPRWLTFTAVDFERDTLAERLVSSGFDPSQPSFFSWLGVVPYLSEPAIFATLGYIASLPGGAHVVFDYGDPPETLSAEARADSAARAQRVAALGEAIITHFEPSVLHARLSALGYRQLEDLGPAQLRERYLPGIPASNITRGGHVLHAKATKPKPAKARS